MVIESFFSGVILCIGLCMVFGPQNIFILRTGLDGRNKWTVIMSSFCCEVALLSISVFGLGLWLKSVQWLLALISLGGTCFLAYYSATALINVIKNNYTIHSLSENPESNPRKRLKMAIFTAFAMACLNPSSLMDTMVVIPSIVAPYDLTRKFAFLSGHLATIFIWFSSLCLASTQMRKLFKNPRAWKGLDILVFVLMSYLVIKMSIVTASYF